MGKAEYSISLKSFTGLPNDASFSEILEYVGKKGYDVKRKGKWAYIYKDGHCYGCYGSRTDLINFVIDI
jgi:hypothetical protein